MPSDVMPLGQSTHHTPTEQLPVVFAEAGLLRQSRADDEPGEGRKRPHACLLARKSEP
jgi:hypothetical protein